MKFDKLAWEEKDTLEPMQRYLKRKCMLNDLLLNEPLIGLTLDSLVLKLGLPARNFAEWEADYFIEDISDPFALGIDPVMEKYLVFKLDFDTSIDDYRVRGFYLDTLRH